MKIECENCGLEQEVRDCDYCGRLGGFESGEIGGKWMCSFRCLVSAKGYVDQQHDFEIGTDQ